MDNTVRYLLRYLNIETCKQALNVTYVFVPEKQFPQKSLYALEELLEN